MKRPYQITAVMCLVLAAFIARESLTLRYYTPLGPGPGFFPFWLSVVFGMLTAVLFWQATFGRTDPMPADFLASRAGYLRMAAIVASLVGTVVLLNPLGYRLTTLACYLFLLTALGRPGPVVTGLTALAGSFGVYQVFVSLLKIPLPVGILDI